MDLSWLAVRVFGVFVLLVLTQDIQIFPGVLFSLLSSRLRDPKTLPPEVESIFVTTDDGKRLEVWRLPAAPDRLTLPFVGVIFHGNGASLEGFLTLQLWFHYLGMTSYGFDYRGFGKSSGWPSERGLEQDSDAVWRYVAEREQLPPEQIIIVGFSVGSALAARIASLHPPRILLLVSAFTSLKQTIRDKRFFRPFAPFVWYELSTIDWLRKLEKSPVILMHGGDDKLNLPYHAEELASAYRGRGPVESLIIPDANHNSVFFAGQEELTELLRRELVSSR